MYREITTVEIKKISNNLKEFKRKEENNKKNTYISTTLDLNKREIPPAYQTAKNINNPSHLSKVQSMPVIKKHLSSVKAISAFLSESNKKQPHAIAIDSQSATKTTDGIKEMSKSLLIFRQVLVKKKKNVSTLTGSDSLKSKAHQLKNQMTADGNKTDKVVSIARYQPILKR